MKGKVSYYGYHPTKMAVWLVCVVCDEQVKSQTVLQAVAITPTPIGERKKMKLLTR